LKTLAVSDFVLTLVEVAVCTFVLTLAEVDSDIVGVVVADRS